MKLGMNELWPTKVKLLKMDMTEMANEVLSVIDMSKPASNLGGVDLFDTQNPVFLRFKEAVLAEFSEYLREVTGFGLQDYPHSFTKAWLTYGSGTTMIPYHNHAGSQFSAVFYLMADGDGDIVFTDPRGNANRGYDSNMLRVEFSPVKHSPQAGDALIFPSFLFHYVAPFTSRFRICLAVDLFLRSRDD